MTMVLMATFGLLHGEVSSAALGGSVESVGSDQHALKAERRTQAQATFQMHELTAASGTVVREYTDATGVVFAVTWKGPFRPDLQMLLGPSFARFTAAAQLPHALRRSLMIHDDDLVVESTGHMRAFAGRAYLPHAVPAGVDVAALQ